MNIFSLSTERKIALIFTVLYGFGAAFHAIDGTRVWVINLTDVFLLAGNFVVLYFVLRKINSKYLFIIWVLATIFFTLMIEIFGVATGNIFGIYEYGNTMHFKIQDVPVVIAINWAVLILATYSISLVLTSIRWIRPLLAGFLIVIFDLFLEPVAQKLDYWNWEGGIIPAQNYFAWAVIAIIVSSFLEIFRIKTHSYLLRVYFFIQLIFFVVLNLVF